MAAVVVEVENDTPAAVPDELVRQLAQRVLAGEGVTEAELGVQFVEAERMRALKAEHLGIDEITDVLSFPIDGRDELGDGLPRQLGDVVLCPAVVGDAWRRPLVHGLLHLLGYVHGDEMERREDAYAGEDSA